MINNRKLIIRKAKDGINHEAVIKVYCGVWLEKEISSGYTPSEALRSLRQSIITDIYLLEMDLDLIDNGKIIFETEE